jgi:hypothetical protein
VAEIKSPDEDIRLICASRSLGFAFQESPFNPCNGLKEAGFYWGSPRNHLIPNANQKRRFSRPMYAWPAGAVVRWRLPVFSRRTRPMHP